MKKHILIFFWGICYSTISLCQTFELELNPNLSSYIHLYEKEKKFIITMVFQASEDIIQTDLISFGSFTYQHNDNFILLDESSGAKLRIQIQKTQSSFMNPKGARYLYVKKGFIWMNNKFFNQINSSSSQTELSYAQLYMDEVKNTALIQNENVDAKKNDLLPGIYYSENASYFSINLEENGDYFIKLWNIIISLGKWNRKNNLLTLEDSNVDAMFFIEIQRDKLKTNSITPLSMINKKLVKLCDNAPNRELSPQSIDKQD